MFESKVKQLLSQGKAAWGASLPDASDLIAKLTGDTGVDFLWIDTEHRPFDTAAVPWVPIICRQQGCVPLLRVAGADAPALKKALDIGASAILVPQSHNRPQPPRAVQDQTE